MYLLRLSPTRCFRAVGYIIFCFSLALTRLAHSYLICIKEALRRSIRIQKYSQYISHSLSHTSDDQSPLASTYDN